MEKAQFFRKVYLPPPHKGKLPLPRSGGEGPQNPTLGPCQPACSNRAKSWSQTLETKCVRWARRSASPETEVHPSVGRLEASADNHTKSQEIVTGRARPRSCGTRPTHFAGRSSSNSSSGQPQLQQTASGYDTSVSKPLRNRTR